jgi:hypothetical protein
MSKRTFTSLEAAYRFYVEQSIAGKAATFETVVQCREWLVVVYA